MMKSRRLTAVLLGVALVALYGAYTFFPGASPVHAATQATYYVSPNGSDSNPGTIDQPFQTLDHARSVVNGLASNMSGDIVVYLRGGTYQLNQTLTFGPSDSGTNGYNVIYQAYPGETPVISGAQTITGWSQYDSSKNIWAANVGTSLQTRQLYVNGVRATRANSGSGIPGTVTTTSTGYTTTDTSMQSWSNPSDVEFVYTGLASAGRNWRESRCGVASISGDSGSTTITMQQPCWSNGTANGLLTPSSIENNYALLSQPGQWYLDHAAGVLYYIPRAGEDMSTADVEAPVLESLVTGSGSLGNPVHNIEFNGITFEYATWLQPGTGDGFIDLQADVAYVGNPTTTATMPGNIAFHTAQNLQFSGDTFTHLGAEGLEIDDGAQNNTVTGNIFTDISGSAVRIGDVTTPDPSDSRQQDTGNTVSDNYIHNIGAEYHSAVGIFVGYTSGSTLSHNQIDDVPYSGISNGWGWGQQTTYMQNNQITDNLIFNVMQLLADGGGIYTLSPQGTSYSNGMTISGNVVNNQVNDYNALYTDEGSEYITLSNNVEYDVPYDWGGCTNTGEPTGNMTYENNFWQGTTGFGCGTPPNLVYQNNTLITGPADCAANSVCQAIVNAAGLESSYQYLASGDNDSAYDLALNGTASASSDYSSDYSAGKANDGNISTGWSASGTDTGAWWEVDLGSAHTLTQIELVTRQDIDQSATRQNFVIWASNNADMSLGHVVLGSQGSTPLAYQATWLTNVTDTTQYRYVAVVKTDGGYFFVSELRVMGY